jgi:hypothetical protein
MNTDEYGYCDKLTERVLGAVFEVANTLGAGFLEKVYERALLRELALRGIRAAAQASLAVTYKGHHVGEYFADILVEPVSSDQFPEAQSRMEAHHVWVPDPREDGGATRAGLAMSII